MYKTTKMMIFEFFAYTLSFIISILGMFVFKEMAFLVAEILSVIQMIATYTRILENEGY